MSLLAAPTASSARTRGFTLTELAVVLAILGLLMGGLMYTLTAQVEQRNFADTQRRLEEARELLLAFALANGRLPCPAISTSNGDEAPSGGGACTTYNANGFLPAIAIGFHPVDSAGFAVDAWGNRLRYAVSDTAANPVGSSSCVGPATPAFTSSTNLKSNSVKCVPNKLVICDASQGTDPGPPSCGTARSVTNQLTVAAVVYSIGKNGAITTPGADEAENTDGDGVFVYHEPRPSGATGGEFDDQIVWIPVGLLFNRLVAAGVLP
jgi:prepilin-type N-terminal cleavage/methylation domain-containing protein